MCTDKGNIFGFLLVVFFHFRLSSFPPFGSASTQPRKTLCSLPVGRTQIEQVWIRQDEEDKKNYGEDVEVFKANGKMKATK